MNSQSSIKINKDSYYDWASFSCYWGVKIIPELFKWRNEFADLLKYLKI